MNTELSNKLIEIISAIQNGVGKASDFAVNQLPDIAQQYITYGRVSATVATLLYLVLTVGLSWTCIVNIYKAQNARYDHEAGFVSVSILTGIGALLSAKAFFCTMDTFFVVWFAPKIYLIKGLAALIH